MAAVKRFLLSVKAMTQAYLVSHGGVLTLIDTGTPGSAGRTLHAIEGIGRRPDDVKQIVLTHCHGDHAGDALALREATGAPVIAGEADAEVIRGSAPYPGPRRWLAHTVYRSLEGFPRFTVDVKVAGRTDVEGGLVLIPTPGHTPGHLAVYAPELGAVFTGDAVWHLGPLRSSWKVFTVDPAENIRSIRRMAELGPAQAYFGHGAPLREGAAVRLSQLASGSGEGGPGSGAHAEAGT
jgi:glyoxylase-like metal-dependent hydrolase (beta-lactamase superfamily II)